MKISNKKEKPVANNLEISELTEAIISIYCNELYLNRSIKKIKKKMDFKFGLLFCAFGIYALAKEGLLPKIKE